MDTSIRLVHCQRDLNLLLETRLVLTKAVADCMNVMHNAAICSDYNPEVSPCNILKIVENELKLNRSYLRSAQSRYDRILSDYCERLGEYKSSADGSMCIAAGMDSGSVQSVRAGVRFEGQPVTSSSAKNSAQNGSIDETEAPFALQRVASRVNEMVSKMESTNVFSKGAPKISRSTRPIKRVVRKLRK